MDSLLVSPYLYDPFSAHDHVHHQTFIITNMDHTELPTFPLPSTGADFLSFTLSSISLQGICSNDCLDHIVSQLKSYGFIHSIDTVIHHVSGTIVGDWKTANTNYLQTLS